MHQKETKFASKRKIIIITNREREGRTGERKEVRKKGREKERKQERKEGKKGRKKGSKEETREDITYENRYCQSALGGGFIYFSSKFVFFLFIALLHV